MKRSCESIRSELSAYVDNELPLTERTVVERHLSGCPRCQGELEELKTLAAAVTAMPGLQPAPQFLADVRRKIARSENPRESTWPDYLFRPFWLKIPLEALAAVVIAAIVMSIERSPSEQRDGFASREDVAEKVAPALAANEAQSPAKEAPRGLTRGVADESLRSPTVSAPVPMAQSASSEELPKRHFPVVVVQASDFDNVQKRVQQIVISMNGRFVSPPDREAAARTVFVELPETSVALFKTRLLQATEPIKAGDESRLTAAFGAAAGITSSTLTVSGIGPTVLTGKAGTNLMVGGGSERLRAATESKAATVVLEIQIVPPPN